MFFRIDFFTLFSIFGPQSFLFLHKASIPCHKKQTPVPRALLFQTLTASEAPWKLQSASGRQKATGLGPIPHVHRHTQLYLDDEHGMVVPVALFLWVAWQVTFEGNTNAFTVPLLCNSHILTEIAEWAAWCLWFLPAVQQMSKDDI